MTANSNLGQSLVDSFVVQESAAAMGFDWPEVQQVLDKIREETDEVDQALRGQTFAAIEEEVSDLLFVMVNLVRHIHKTTDSALAPAHYFEHLLQNSLQKFARRFQYVEQGIQSSPVPLTLAQMEALWQTAKSFEPK